MIKLKYKIPTNGIKRLSGTWTNGSSGEGTFDNFKIVYVDGIMDINSTEAAIKRHLEEDYKKSLM